MKKRIFTILLLACITVGSLSSCLMLDASMLMPGTGSGGSVNNTTVNVTGGPTYENVNITSNYNKNLLAASKAVLSAVTVVSYFDEYQYSYNGSYTGQTKETGSLGSGVIYTLDKENGDAYVITNYHVVYNANSTASDGISQRINLYLYGMEKVTNDDVSYAIPATYVGGSMSYDLAVLKVSKNAILMASNARAVDFADSDDVSILDTAIAIGNAGGEGLSATVGCISVDSEEIYVKIDTKNSAVAVQLRVMRTDAAVNSGNSGGGLFNDEGKLIGIVNARDADTESDNIGYAIPSNVVKGIVDNAIYYSDGTVKRCMIGIKVGVKEYSTEYDIQSGKIHKIEKVVISELTSDRAKEYFKVGDVINSITVDGKTYKVTRVFHVIDRMLAARVGSEVVINITDADGTRDVIIPITENMLTNY